MCASISLMVRYGLHSLTRKLAIEGLAVSLPIIVALTIPPTLTKPVASFSQTSGRQSGFEGGPAADQTNAEIKEFMTLVALSHAASLKPTAPAAAVGITVPSGPATLTSVPALSRAAVTPGASEPRFRMAHIAERGLPAPRATLETVEPAVDAAQAREEPRAENIVSVSDATSSIAKKL
jgi:hypothetical protein